MIISKLPPSIGSTASPFELAWRAALPIVLLLILQIGLYVWMAPRGFDFTDESYYFLNYLYWREMVGVVSYFGAYFELPFRFFGQSVPAIRIFGLLLLLGSSAFFMRAIFAYIARRDGTTSEAPWPFVVVGMAASMFYFGYLSTLRAPSYNLLTLCSMLMATGLLLRLLEPRAHLARGRVGMLCYGLALGACGLGKPSTGALLLVCHALFFALANRDWRLGHLLEFAALSLVGASLNFAVLQWVHPQWLTVLREGAAIFGYSSEFKLLNMAKGFWLEILGLLPELPWAIGAAAAFIMLVRWVGPLHRVALSALVGALVASCVIGLSLRGYLHQWLPLLGLTVLLLWGVECISRKPFRLARGDATDLGLTGLLFALPVVFSFGTSMPLLEHSQKAAVFVIAALCLRLYRISRLGILTKPTIVLCLTALCIPTLVIQLKSALDVQYTYRQLHALGEQTISVRLGAASNTLLVDATTRDTLQSVIVAARAAGFEHDQAILDFTGDGPGIIYALGGRPLGLAWLLGGYSSNSEIWAERMVANLSSQALQSAWLLSSDNNPRAINGWKKLLNTRLGLGAHELVATVHIHAPYRWGENAPDSLSVQIWKPRVSSVPGNSQ
ncbi:MAG: hypothetical protein Q8L02_02145 [Candidatus Nitrotoga sp.]|nr:hypothetical protein [Candidatus Nitrotoga sp.]